MYRLFLLSFLVFLSGCKDIKRTSVLNRRTRTSQQIHQIEPINLDSLNVLPTPQTGGITIFIHGAQTTRSLLETCLPRTLSKSLLENYTLPDGLYSLEAIGHQLSEYFPSTNNNLTTKKIIGHTTLRQWYTLAKILSEVAPEKFCLNTSYFFVWHGPFNQHTRRRAGRHLARIIKSIKDKSITSKTNLPLTLVTYSHGGNVALNTVPVLEHALGENSIETLILLGCPIQEATEPYAHSPVFKHVYSFFTPFDIVQLIAPQRGYGWLFSKQMFTPDPKITQIECLWHGKPLGHFDFIEPDFIKHVPEIIKALNAPLETLEVSPVGAYCVDVD
jgi:hypothetical protein